jgi:hypothetical protein
VLHSAAHRGWHEIVKWVVENMHMDVNVKTKGGWTVLQCALKMKCDEDIQDTNRRVVVRSLVKHAKAHIEDADVEEALMYVSDWSPIATSNESSEVE